MGGGGGAAGGGGGGAGGCGPICWATWVPRLVVTVGSGGSGGAPTANRLRCPPSRLTACTFASRSSRKVGSMVMGSTRSSGRFGLSDGRNSSLLAFRADVGRRVSGAVSKPDGFAGRPALFCGPGRLGFGLGFGLDEGPDNTLL